MAAIGIAFPLHEGDRIKLRKIGRRPLPAICPNSTAMPCTTCGMTLAVGPRLTMWVQAGLAKVYCLYCGYGQCGPDAPITNLGNPDSGVEE